jgi:acyl dehydratase
MNQTAPSDSTPTPPPGEGTSPGEWPVRGLVARRSREVAARDIELFTALSGDRNPLHYDAELAARSRFGGIVVQGGVTTALLNAVVAEDVPGPGSVFLHTDWRFLAPVRPGDVITAEVEVVATRADKPVTTLRTTIRNQAGVVVLDGTAAVWRDPVVAAAHPTSSPATTPGADVRHGGASPSQPSIHHTDRRETGTSREDTP